MSTDMQDLAKNWRTRREVPALVDFKQYAPKEAMVVEFTISILNLDNGTWAAFKTVFGYDLRNVETHKTQVICTTDDFARFLITRNNHGGKNLFKELNARLKPANPVPSRLVSPF